MTYTCEDARRDIDVFFSEPWESKNGDEAQNRALKHIVAHGGTTSHEVVCQPCWDYYMDQKGLYCGG